MTRILEVQPLGIVRVTVAYFAAARECAGIAEEKLELTRPAFLEQLFSKVIAIHPSLAKIKGTLRLLVNGIGVSEDTELKDGDRIAFLPPVGGG
jgi:MoaD family protein